MGLADFGGKPPPPPPGGDGRAGRGGGGKRQPILPPTGILRSGSKGKGPGGGRPRKPTHDGTSTKTPDGGATTVDGNRPRDGEKGGRDGRGGGRGRGERFGGRGRGRGKGGRGYGGRGGRGPREGRGGRGSTGELPQTPNRQGETKPKGTTTTSTANKNAQAERKKDEKLELPTLVISDKMYEHYQTMVSLGPDEMVDFSPFRTMGKWTRLTLMMIVTALRAHKFTGEDMTKCAAYWHDKDEKFFTEVANNHNRSAIEAQEMKTGKQRLDKMKLSPAALPHIYSDNFGL